MMFAQLCDEIVEASHRHHNRLKISERVYLHIRWRILSQRHILSDDYDIINHISSLDQEASSKTLKLVIPRSDGDSLILTLWVASRSQISPLVSIPGGK